MAFLYVFIKLHVILFNEVLNNKFPKTNPAVPSSLLAPESWGHCHWISTPLHIRATTGSHGSHMKTAHNVLYTKKDIQKYASYPAMDISCMPSWGMCRSRSIEGGRYIEMHRGPHTYWARLLQGAGPVCMRPAMPINYNARPLF